jgi:hypothetical protein
MILGQSIKSLQTRIQTLFILLLMKSATVKRKRNFINEQLKEKYVNEKYRVVNSNK